MAGSSAATSTTPRDASSFAIELPPRARGRPGGVMNACKAVRTTPACAGTTPWSDWTVSGPGNYPRVRGDDLSPRWRGIRYPELPPRARGRHHSSSPLGNRDRTTPACAGTTC